MSDPRAALPDLIARLLADGELDDDDLALIHDATVGAAQARQEAKRLMQTAHVHDVPHAPAVTLVPYDTGARSGMREDVDASGIVCHDCGSGLVADTRHARVLVCPSLHDRRVPLTPTEPDGAVECGRTRP